MKEAITFKLVICQSFSRHLFKTNSYAQFFKPVLQMWKKLHLFAALFGRLVARGASGCSQGTLPSDMQYFTRMTHPKSLHFLCY